MSQIRPSPARVPSAPRVPPTEQEELPTLVSTDGVVLPPGESDETKRLALATWARTQNLRSLAVAASALATVLSAMIIVGC